jgi:hypothetical protein
MRNAVCGYYAEALTALMPGLGQGSNSSHSSGTISFLFTPPVARGQCKLSVRQPV